MSNFKSTKIIIDEIDREFLKKPVHYQKIYDEYAKIILKREQPLNKETILAMYGSKK